MTPAPMTPAKASALLGRTVTVLSAARSSGNSRVFRAHCADGAVFAVKAYPSDGRDRIGAETGALSFLGRHGVEAVPRVVALDRAANIAAYDWLDGEPVEAASDADLDAAMAFLGRLHGLRQAEGAEALPPASEACLTVAELLAQLDRRFDRLAQIPELTIFLAETVFPALAEARADVRDQPCQPTLSPSDFGFHNALRLKDGRLAFLDFEYFGWDDPVKLTADTMLHPGMGLTTRQQRRVKTAAEIIYGEDYGFPSRLSMLYPLYAMRWCAIILNEFLPERWIVRAHAGATDQAAVQSRQLAKAQAFMQRLPQDHRDVFHAS